MTAISAPARFDMGRVISATFAGVGRHGFYFSALALVLVAVPNFAVLRVIDPLTVFTSGPDPFWTWVAASLVSLALLSVMRAAIAHRTIATDRGWASSLGATLKRTPLLLGLAFLNQLAIMVAAIALVFPAFMLMARWAVAIPVLTVERRGVMEAFGRSAKLTEGHRWAIFGLMLIYGLAAGIMGYIPTAFAGGQAKLHTNLPMLAAYTLVQAACATVAAAGAAALYKELLRLKEGGSSGELAAVFD